MWHPCTYVQKMPLQRVHWPELERPASLPSDSDTLFIPLPSQHLIVLPSITNMFLDYSSLSLFLPHPFSPLLLSSSLPHSLSFSSVHLCRSENNTGSLLFTWCRILCCLSLCVPSWPVCELLGWGGWSFLSLPLILPSHHRNTGITDTCCYHT